jgi:hypothetical protein
VQSVIYFLAMLSLLTFLLCFTAGQIFLPAADLRSKLLPSHGTENHSYNRCTHQAIYSSHLSLSRKCHRDFFSNNVSGAWIYAKCCNHLYCLPANMPSGFEAGECSLGW